MDFSLNTIKAAMGDHPWAEQIIFFDTTDSTNTQAKRLAASGVPEGTVLIAAHQTAGRGRLGRQFHSPADVGIYMSLILRPRCKPDKLMHLTCAAGVAMCDAVEEALSFRSGIKWINDLVHDRKKLAGILVELLFDSQGNVDAAIVGIGINCNHQVQDFPPELQKIATSAAMITGKPVDRNTLAAAMIRRLHRMNEALSQPLNTMEQYRQDCITIGQQVSIHRGESIRYGQALSVDDEGGLVARYDNGEIATVTSGEVSVRGMYGYV